MQITDEQQLQDALTEIQRLTPRREEPAVAERLLVLEAATAQYGEQLRSAGARPGRPKSGA